MARASLSGLVALFVAAVSFTAVAVRTADQAHAAANDHGGYTFRGGTARERATVRAALEASTFDWRLLHAEVVIHITRRGDSHSTKGHIWLGAPLLARGKVAWGIVQHEYAHQIDFLLLTDAMRAKLARALGAKVWWRRGKHLRHSQLGCERFASTLAWAYWTSRSNSLIRYARDEATAMPPAKFRHLVDTLVTPTS